MSYNQLNTSVNKPLSRSQLMTTPSTKQLSYSQYMENKNLPNSNSVSRLQHDQAASFHLLKPKIDPQAQINHYVASSRGNLHQNSISPNTSQITPPTRNITPSKSPSRVKQNRVSVELNQLIQTTLTPKQYNLQEDYYVPQELEIERNQSFNPNSEEAKKRGQQIFSSQGKPKQSGGLFSCLGGEQNDSQRGFPQQEQYLNELNQAKQEIGMLNEEIQKCNSQHQQEKDNLNYQIRLFQDKANDNERKLNSQDYPRLISENSKLRSDNVLLQDTVNSLRAENEERMREADKIGIQYKNKFSEVDTIKIQCNDKDRQIQLLTKVNQELQNNTSNTQRLKELEQHCLVMTYELDKLTKTLTEKSEQLEMANQQLNNVHSENQMMKRQSTEIKRIENNNLGKLQSDNSLLIEQVNQLGNRNKQLEKDLMDAGQKMKNYNIEINKLEQIAKDQAGDTFRTNEKLARDNQQLQQQISELKNRINYLEQEQKQISGTNQQLTQVTYQQEKKIKDQESYISKGTELLKQIKELQSQRDTLTAQKDSLNQQLIQKEGQLQQKDSLNAQKESALLQKDIQLKQKDAQILPVLESEAYLRKQLEDANFRLQGWQKESDRIKEDKSKDLAILQSQLYDLKVHNQKLNDDNIKLAFECEQLQKKGQADLSKQIEVIEKNLRLLFDREKDQLQDRISSLNYQLQTYQERVRTLETEKQILESDRVKRSKNQQEEENIKLLQNENEKLRSNLSVSEMNIQSIKRENEEQKRSLENQKRNLLDQIEAGKREREILSQQNRQLTIVAQQSDEEKKRLILDFDFRFSEQERQHKKQNKNDNDLIDKIAQLERQIEEERMQRQDFSDMTVQHNAEKTSLETQILKLNTQVNERDQEIKRLIQENKILTAQGVERMNMIENWKRTTSVHQGDYLNSGEDNKRRLQDLEEQLLREKHQKTTIQNQLLKYESDLKNKEDEVNKLYQLIEKRKLEQEGQKQIITDLKSQTDQLREKAKLAEAESLIKTEYYDRWFLENDELQRQVNYYKQQLNGVQSSMTMKSKEIDDNLIEVRQLKNKYEDAITESKNLSKSNGSLYSPHTYHKKDQSSINSQGEQNSYHQTSNKPNTFDQQTNYIFNTTKYPSNSNINQQQQEFVSFKMSQNQSHNNQIPIRISQTIPSVESAQKYTPYNFSSLDNQNNHSENVNTFNTISFDKSGTSHNQTLQQKSNTYNPTSINNYSYSIEKSVPYVYEKNNTYNPNSNYNPSSTQYQIPSYSSTEKPKEYFQHDSSAKDQKRNDYQIDGLAQNQEYEFNLNIGNYNQSNENGELTPRYASPSTFAARNQKSPFGDKIGGDLQFPSSEQQSSFKEGNEQSKRKYYDNLN